MTVPPQSPQQPGPPYGGPPPGAVSQPPPAAQGYGAPGRADLPSAADASGFFSALFDLSFSKFVTVKFAKVIFILVVLVNVLAWAFWVLAGFASDSPVFGVMALLFGWIPALIYIVLARVGLEIAVAVIKTAENTAALRGR